MRTYFLKCSCGNAEVVGSHSGRCEGCGEPYSGLTELPSQWRGQTIAYHEAMRDSETGEAK
jgi:hypothetical protein